MDAWSALICVCLAQQMHARLKLAAIEVPQRLRGGASATAPVPISPLSAAFSKPPGLDHLGHSWVRRSIRSHR